jgi:hypothetical protein
MTVSPEDVRQIFRGLEVGNGEAFFNHVSDAVTSRNASALSSEELFV